MWFILQQFLQVFLYCSSIYNRLFVGLNWYPVSIDLRDFALTSARLGFPTGASKSYTTSTWIVSSCHLHILVPSKYFQGTKYDYFACLFFPWNSVSHKSDLSMIFPQLYFFLLLLFLTEPHFKCPPLHLHLFIGFSSFHTWVYSQNKSEVVSSTQGDSAL